MESSNKLYCIKGGEHFQEQIQWVCLNQNCRKNSLACTICAYLEHQNHQLIPLKLLVRDLPKQIEEKISNLQGSNKENDLKKVYDALEKCRAKTRNSIDDVIQEAIQYKEEIMKSFTSINDRINQLFPSLDSIMCVLVEFQQSQTNYASLQSQIEQLLPLSNFVNATSIDPASNPKEFCNNVIQWVDTLEQQFLNINKDINKLFETQKTGLIAKLQTDEFFLEKQIKFTNFRPLDFKYSNEFTKVTKLSSSNYSLCLLEPELSQNSKLNFSFKIIKNAGWLAVGVIHKKKAEQAGYIFKYSTFDHGGYFISCNGGSWSSVNSALNNVIKSFTFADNDIIDCFYDGLKKEIKFSNKNKSKEHTLEIKHLEDDVLIPAVVLYYVNSEVEIAKN